MNQSNSNDKESAAFSISGNEISCFFVLLSFQFLIVSYFFGITNKSMLPNYVSDFLTIEFFTEKSIECFLMFFFSNTCNYNIFFIYFGIIFSNYIRIYNRNK